MLDDLSGPSAAHRLRQAAEDAGLSTAARTRAGELAARLLRNVRIVFLGPSGVGKSALVDVILGGKDATDTPEKTRYFGADIAHDASLTQNGAVAFLPMDQSVLGHAQVIDVACPTDASAFDRYVQEYLSISDIVVWCTQRFEPQEARLWGQASDTLKDHSFLVLTKADMLADDGILKERVASLQSVVAEEFHSFFPVTTPALKKLQETEAFLPETAYAASGVKALKDALTSLVRSGQRADLDSALLFLERQGLMLDDDFAPAESAETVTPIAAVSEVLDTAATHSPCAALRTYLISRAFDLAEISFDESEGDMTDVLELCGNISEQMADDMRSLAQDEPDYQPWSTAFEQASDKIMLMTMENDTRSAADAVSILLQLRRDLDQLAFS